MKILTKEDFAAHPELNVQGVSVGQEVEEGELFINQQPDYQNWAESQGRGEGEEDGDDGDNGGGNPPPPIPFP